MQQLWELAKDLPVKKVRVSELAGFDDVHWFGGPRNLLPTCRAIADHARDIFECDLSYPIIIAPDGEVLDGWHRICKAHINGVEELDAVQLTSFPPTAGASCSPAKKFPSPTRVRFTSTCSRAPVGSHFA